MNKPHTMSAPEVVQNLLQVISRKLPLSKANDLLDDNLHAYMDGKNISNSKSAWFRWVQFLHHYSDKNMSNLSIEINTLKEIGIDKVEVKARWCGNPHDSETQKFSEVGTVTYEVHNGKITSIWTHRKNYVFIYGKQIATNPLRFYWILLRLTLWTPPVVESKNH